MHGELHAEVILCFSNGLSSSDENDHMSASNLFDTSHIHHGFMRRGSCSQWHNLDKQAITSDRSFGGCLIQIPVHAFIDMTHDRIMLLLPLHDSFLFASSLCAG